MVPVEFVPHGYDPDVHRVVTPNTLRPFKDEM